MKVVHSFDIFDTLVGRYHTDPKSIFSILERHLSFPNFLKLRVLAEKQSNGTLDDIYMQFKELTQISNEEVHQLKEKEIEIELSQVFPILENVNQIQEGDILVSDTYYDSQTLKRILTKIGLQKDLEIFASPLGKRNGSIWDAIKKNYAIIEHLGDNPLTDGESAQAAGIKTKLYKGGAYTNKEELAIASGERELANLMRTLRLLNPYLPHTPAFLIWNEQCQINIPILIQTCFYLDEQAQLLGKNRLLFSLRDCCHLIRLFPLLFPHYQSLPFFASRLVYQKPSSPYIAYVKSLYTDKTFIVDAQGSGNTCIEFFKKHLCTFPDYLAIVGQPGHLYPIHTVAFGYSARIERLNYSLEGTLIDYQEGPIQREPEYDLQFITPSHACIDQCVKLLKEFSFKGFNQQLVNAFLAILDREIVISKYVSHHDFH